MPWNRALRAAEAEVTGEPFTQATSDALNVPPRDKRDVAISVMREALRLIALPAGGDAGLETPLERRMRQSADIALQRADALLGKGEGE